MLDDATNDPVRCSHPANIAQDRMHQIGRLCTEGWRREESQSWDVRLWCEPCAKTILCQAIPSIGERSYRIAQTIPVGSSPSDPIASNWRTLFATHRTWFPCPAPRAPQGEPPCPPIHSIGIVQRPAGGTSPDPIHHLDLLKLWKLAGIRKLHRRPLREPKWRNNLPYTAILFA